MGGGGRGSRGGDEDWTIAILMLFVLLCNMLSLLKMQRIFLCASSPVKQEEDGQQCMRLLLRFVVKLCSAVVQEPRTKPVLLFGVQGEHKHSMSLVYILQNIICCELFIWQMLLLSKEYCAL